jgi:FkbM family methyltransferase
MTSTRTVFGKLVFDVGANQGNKTAEYLAYGASRVICFEPQQHLVQHLQQRFKSEIKDGTVFVYDCALGPENTTMNLYPSSADTISTMSQKFQTGRFVGQGYTWNAPIPVPVQKVHHFIETHGNPDYMKIDVEGFEWSVLQGLDRVFPTVISFEYSEEFPEEYTKILDWLESKGYGLFTISLGESGIFSLRWGTKLMLLDYLKSIHTGNWSWGDIYAKRGWKMMAEDS